MDVNTQSLSVQEYLHSMNMVHRDLKPENVLVGNDGTLFLCDFGLSKVMLAASLLRLLCAMAATNSVRHFLPPPKKGVHRQH